MGDPGRESDMDFTIRFDCLDLRIGLERMELGGLERDGKAHEDDRIVLVLDDGVLADQVLLVLIELFLGGTFLQGDDVITRGLMRFFRMRFVGFGGMMMRVLGGLKTVRTTITS